MRSTSALLMPLRSAKTVAMRQATAMVANGLRRLIEAAIAGECGPRREADGERPGGQIPPYPITVGTLRGYAVVVAGDEDRIGLPPRKSGDSEQRRDPDRATDRPRQRTPGSANPQAAIAGTANSTKP